MTAQPATISSSEVRVMKSTSTGRKYRVMISLPYFYFKPSKNGPIVDRARKWPTVYLLDADFYFGMVTDLIRSMAWGGRTMDAMVVGIGYPEDNDPEVPWSEAVAGRSIDFTPVDDANLVKESGEWTRRPLSMGDAAGFHSFIRNELIPSIDKRYQADPFKRVLAGHSLGGLFGLFALFQEPRLFDAYVIGSASFWYGDKWTFRREEEYSKRHTRLKARVYLSAGELEESANNPRLTHVRHFATTLENRNYQGLTLAKQIFPNLNHFEVIAPGYQGGLMWALIK